jgi:hypothetical protein
MFDEFLLSTFAAARGRRCTPEATLTRGKCVVDSGKRRKIWMPFLPKGCSRREGKVRREMSTLLQGRDAVGELDEQGTDNLLLLVV